MFVNVKFSEECSLCVVVYRDVLLMFLNVRLVVFVRSCYQSKVLLFRLFLKLWRGERRC